MTIGAYDTSGWSDFFVAASGASAALAGLVFVGVSINLARILQFSALPDRAAQTLVILANSLVATVTLLGPDRRGTGLGGQVLIIGLLGWAGGTATGLNASRRAAVAPHRARWTISAQMATLPFVVAGASLLATAGGGLYWVQVGVAVSLSVGLLNAWVLLVEIMR